MITSEITLKQIAKLSGFSISTVSKALNDKHDIGRDTMNKIKKLAKIYNYVPNNMAIALRSRKASTIAVLLPRFSISLYSNILEGVMEEASHNDYKLLIYQLKYYENEKGSLFSIIDGSIDGLIVLNNDTNNQTLLCQELNIVRSNRFPFIELSFNIENIQDDKNTNATGELICKELLKKISNKEMTNKLTCF